jgi:hypothetical protein
MPDSFRVGTSMSLLETGDVFVFVGLRHKGEDMADAMKRANSFPMKMVTVFSISTSGSLCYRIDDVSDEEAALAVLDGQLPEVPADKSVLFSLPYTDAMALVEQAIWSSVRQDIPTN